jgi:hypothetical protein
MINRREFIVQLSLGSAALVSAHVMAQGGMMAESDTQAAAFGYKIDAGEADSAKYPKYVVGQRCSNCALYQGKPGDVAGACVLFAGKLVSASGWCGAWTKKS